MEKIGLFVLGHSLIALNAWNDNVSERHTTEIRTTSPRKKYSAVKVIAQSTFMVEEDMLSDYGMLGHVKILNEHLYDSPEYYGVELESASLLLGMSRISFRDPDILDGREDTVPAERQIVGSEDSTIKD